MNLFNAEFTDSTEQKRVSQWHALQPLLFIDGFQQQFIKLQFPCTYNQKRYVNVHHN